VWIDAVSELCFYTQKPGTCHGVFGGEYLDAQNPEFRIQNEITLSVVFIEYFKINLAPEY
jgi:hypothetical protein